MNYTFNMCKTCQRKNGEQPNILITYNEKSQKIDSDADSYMVCDRCKRKLDTYMFKLSNFHKMLQV